jgi:lycopene cyclase domain-containing protein
MKEYTYLLINFLTISFPLLYSFDRRVSYYKSWKALFPALLIGGAVFLLWDHFFTIYGVWSFNPEYIIGIYIFSLPLEEVLFFLTIPYSCIFIYECVHYYFPSDPFKKYSQKIIIIIAAFSILTLFFYYDRIYTAVTFMLLLTMCLYFIFYKKPYLGYFFLAYLFALIPFAVVNGILTAIPVVLYDNTENTGFRWHTIPFEDSFYMMALLMLDTIIYERLKGPGLRL